jgi:hypothetical protein
MTSMPIPAPINPYHQAPLAKRPFNKRAITSAYLVSGSLFHVCYPPPDYPCIGVNEDIQFMNDTMLITKLGSEITPDDRTMESLSNLYFFEALLSQGSGVRCYDSINLNFYTACTYAPSFEQETACFSGINQDSVSFNFTSIFYQEAHGGCGVDSLIYAASGVRIY